jgi:hypothetical protein
VFHSQVVLTFCRQVALTGFSSIATPFTAWFA